MTARLAFLQVRTMSRALRAGLDRLPHVEDHRGDREEPQDQQHDGRDRNDLLHVDPLAPRLLDQGDRDVAAIQGWERQQIDQPDEQHDRGEHHEVPR